MNSSLSEGMLKAYLSAGDPGRAIVVSTGASSEPSSHITRDQAKLISVAPGIAKDVDGSPLADFGINATLPVVRNDGSAANTTMRGVGPKALKVRPELKIVSGRMFQPGRREMVVGILAHTHDRDMKIGDNVAMPDGAWPIVGVFATGDVLESQVLGDADTVMTATHKKSFNSVLVRLESYNSLATFKKALSTNPALAVSVERHNDWYKRFSAGFSGFLTAIAYVIGAILAIGALFGCLNTMYAAVSTRAREIATLRALGFGAFAVAVSVMLEAILLSVAGAVVGAAIAWLLFDGREQPFGNNIYHLTISGAGVGLGVVWAFVVALLGGLAPSIKAARQPVVDALRAT